MVKCPYCGKRKVHRAFLWQAWIEPEDESDLDEKDKSEAVAGADFGDAILQELHCFACGKVFFEDGEAKKKAQAALAEWAAASKKIPVKTCEATLAQYDGDPDECDAEDEDGAT